jgi:NADH-quinone oxidoreductase subunit H
MPELFIYILIKLALVIVIFALWMTMVPLLIWLERKVVADIQIRLGPNRVGPFGLLQPIADALKLIMKEEVTPGEVDKWVYRLAPMMMMVPALLSIAAIPIGGNVTVAGRTFALQIMGEYRGPGGFYVPELDAGILLVLALSSLGVYGVVLAGWSSANKYSLLGGMRSSAQMLSYELPLGVSLVGPLILAGTLRLTGVVEAQWSPYIWFVVPQFLAFVIHLMSGVAEVNRAPFDLPEAEQELIGGYHTEYSSFRFAMFFMAEYLNMVTVSAISVTFFLGGYKLFFNDIGWLGPVWFAGKLIAVLYFFMWIRGTWPRVRFDQLMSIGWKGTLPLALANVLITAAILAFAPSKPTLVLSIASVILGALAFFGISYAVSYDLRRRAFAREQELRRRRLERSVEP